MVVPCFTEPSGQYEPLSKDVIKSYQDYVLARFDRYHNLFIVFDGYDDMMTNYLLKQLRTNEDHYN